MAHAQLSSDFSNLAKALFPAVLKAGQIELMYFEQGVEPSKKPDKSLVSIADLEAEALILSALAAHVPDVPVVAEEAVAAGNIPQVSDKFFLVDALDGTHLFLRKKPEFSVNIGLVVNGKPVFGLIYGPPNGEIYITLQDGEAYEARIADPHVTHNFEDLQFERIRARQSDKSNLIAFNSWKAGGAAKDFLTALGVTTAQPLGSSLKFCRIARGDGDLYVRYGLTYEWDTAAGQAILEAAGGSVVTRDGQTLSYGKANDGYLNPHFVAWAGMPLAVG